eukprot:COSAG01_NODE_8176_length_2890_cov_24.337513_6_plen_141_part_01
MACARSFYATVWLRCPRSFQEGTALRIQPCGGGAQPQCRSVRRQAPWCRGWTGRRGGGAAGACGGAGGVRGDRASDGALPALVEAAGLDQELLRLALGEEGRAGGGEAGRQAGREGGREAGRDRPHPCLPPFCLPLSLPPS